MGSKNKDERGLLTHEGNQGSVLKYNHLEIHSPVDGERYAYHPEHDLTGLSQNYIELLKVLIEKSKNQQSIKQKGRIAIHNVESVLRERKCLGPKNKLAGMYRKGPLSNLRGKLFEVATKKERNGMRGFIRLLPFPEASELKENSK